VEAEDEEAAIDASYNHERFPSLCHHCARIGLGDWEVETVEERS
jgi:hypothetical protein